MDHISACDMKVGLHDFLLIVEPDWSDPAMLHFVTQRDDVNTVEQVCSMQLLQTV